MTAAATGGQDECGPGSSQLAILDAGMNYHHKSGLFINVKSIGASTATVEVCWLCNNLPQINTCYDEDINCPWVAAAGMCGSSILLSGGSYYSTWCRRSCGACTDSGSLCQDYPYKNHQGLVSYCGANQPSNWCHDDAFQHPVCPRSCRTCDNLGCKNNDAQCAGMAAKGWCTDPLHAAMMQQTCRASCNTCSKPSWMPNSPPPAFTIPPPRIPLPLPAAWGSQTQNLAVGRNAWQSSNSDGSNNTGWVRTVISPSFHRHLIPIRNPSSGQ